MRTCTSLCFHGISCSVAGPREPPCRVLYIIYVLCFGGPKEVASARNRNATGDAGEFGLWEFLWGFIVRVGCNDFSSL